MKFLYVSAFTSSFRIVYFQCNSHLLTSKVSKNMSISAGSSNNFSNKIEKLDNRLDRMADAVKIIESRLIKNFDQNTISQFRQKIDRLAETVEFLRERIHFLENRDQVVYERLSRIQPDIEALKNEVSSLKHVLESSAHPYNNLNDSNMNNNNMNNNGNNMNNSSNNKNKSNTNKDVDAHGEIKQLLVRFYHIPGANDSKRFFT